MKGKIDEINEVKVNSLLNSMYYGEVYTKYFVGKLWNYDLVNQFNNSFDVSKLTISDFEKKKIKFFSEWVDYMYSEVAGFNGFDQFPAFMEFYIEHMYTEQGLQLYSGSQVPIIVLENEPDEFENIFDIVDKYESKLVTQPWLTETDIEHWMNLQKKRQFVSEFEDYIYDLQNELYSSFSGDYDEHQKLKIEIYQKHIDKVKLDIARIKLFDFNEGFSTISILERLLEYFIAQKQNENNYFINVNHSTDIKLPPQRGDQSLKIILLNELGILRHLKQFWAEKNINYPIEKILSILICEPENSIRPRISNPEDKSKIYTNGPASRKAGEILEKLCPSIHSTFEKKLKS